MKWMRDMARWLLATMLMVFGLAAHAAPSSDYTLGSGDYIRINVFQNPDLMLEVRIAEGGTISYPLLGTVTLGGLSVSDAEKKIASGLKDGNFLKQPQVSILVLAIKANQVSVLGQVNKPGRYPLEAGSSRLSEVLAYRKEVDFPKVFASTGAQEDFVLQNGDSIWVDRAPQVYIYGEVNRPGAQVLLRDTTLLQALATAGGLTQRGTERGVRVHRRDASGQVQIIQPGMNDKLLPDDIIYVKESLF